MAFVRVLVVVAAGLVAVAGDLFAQKRAAELQDATRIETAQVNVTTYPSAPAVAPGERFSVVVRIAPHRGVHLYAPGADNYKPIQLTIAPHPHVRPQPVTYPRAEIYFFKPLKERIPTYQKPFTLTQAVVLEATPAARAALQKQRMLTLEGTLSYQACDDSLCYDPVVLPLSWTVAMKTAAR